MLMGAISTTTSFTLFISSDMQVFFVMSGFFARLVLTRYGTRKFVAHRLARIALPLVLGWLLLYPIMMFLYARAGLLTDQILTDQGMWEAFRARISADFLFNPSNLLHLWFLYYLLIIYAIALFVRFLFSKVIDRRGDTSSSHRSIFCWCVESRWGVLALAALSTIPLYFEPMWNGVGGFVFYFFPGLAGLLGYLIFFPFGWFLYAYCEMLETMARVAQKPGAWCCRLPAAVRRRDLYQRTRHAILSLSAGELGW